MLTKSAKNFPNTAVNSRPESKSIFSIRFRFFCFFQADTRSSQSPLEAANTTVNVSGPGRGSGQACAEWRTGHSPTATALKFITQLWLKTEFVFLWRHHDVLRNESYIVCRIVFALFCDIWCIVISFICCRCLENKSHDFHFILFHIKSVFRLFLSVLTYP